MRGSSINQSDKILKTPLRLAEVCILGLVSKQQADGGNALESWPKCQFPQRHQQRRARLQNSPCWLLRFGGTRRRVKVKLAFSPTRTKNPLLATFSFIRQWAAVMTHKSLSRDPPQKGSAVCRTADWNIRVTWVHTEEKQIMKGE